jgi:ATP-dependent RNA helicase RhlE
MDAASNDDPEADLTDDSSRELDDETDFNDDDDDEELNAGEEDSLAGDLPPVDPDTAAQQPHPAVTEPVAATEAPPIPKTWEDLDLSADVIEHLRKEGLTNPTPVQAQAIPLAFQNLDLIVTAQTGTGKTAAFALPIIEIVRGKSGTKAVVLAPTREIALQSQKVFEVLGKPFGVEAISLIGGTSVDEDEKLLRTYPQVIIATPGRMCDHIERGNIWLEYIDCLVLDEADRMLDMGFSNQINTIIDQTPKDRQVMLFSATFPPDVEKYANKILHKPERIQIGKTSRTASKVEQRFVFLSERDKFVELEHLLWEEKGTTIVFARSKDQAAKLWRDLRNRGFHQATQLHSNLSQTVREEALADFKGGKYRVLIATDVVGRGIHVDDVAHVINFELPREAEDYVHRIGRTGRADKSGISTTLVTSRDLPTIRQIERLTGKRIPIPEHMLNAPVDRGGSGDRGGRGGGGGRSGGGGGGGRGRRR